MRLLASQIPLSVLYLLPAEIADALSTLTFSESERIEEIRLRCGRQIELVGIEKQFSIRVSPEHIRHVIAVVTGSSVYAVEHELRRGYITAPGGHRVGIAGRVAVDGEGRVKTFRDIGSVSIRIANARPDCALCLSPYMVDERKRLLPTLLVGPPLCGKTTLLRDTARLLGDGRMHAKVPRMRVAIVDERSEIAACLKGVPQFDVGFATDVLDGCPKEEGMYMMVRSMAPQVLLTDEIGSAGEIAAVQNAARAGVVFIGTVHADSPDDLKMRKELADFVASGTIERYVFLSHRRGPGTVESVYDRQLREVTAGCR